jgi:alpha-tubulin suppressor-like RCC1 family protein
VALLADGTIRVWGSGDRGIPGDGRGDVRTNRVAPATVAGISNATGVAAGALTNFALLADGTVRAWGSNWGGLGFFGVLGIGNQRIQDSPTPLSVEGISNAKGITTSGISSLALLADGRVMAWGAAQAALRGQREDWLTTSRPLVVPGIRNAAAVSPFLILLADGSVRELRSPEQRVAGIDNAVAVASDPTNRYALLADGRLVGWGLRQFWPKGMVTVAEFGAETARECSARSK